jgi:hypothetical protein
MVLEKKLNLSAQTRSVLCVRIDVLPCEADRSAIWHTESGDASAYRRLSASALSYKAQDRAFVNREGHVSEDLPLTRTAQEAPFCREAEMNYFQ